MLNRLKQILAPIRYWRELPLRQLDDRPAKETAPPARIPPVVIQTWEDRLFGKSHLAEMRKFRDLNPELSFELWDRDRREGYLRDRWGTHPIFEIYRRSLFGPMKADIFRYCLMADRGGYYFDISKGCTTPLRALHGPETEALITFEPHASPLTCPPAIVTRLRHPDKLLLQWGFGFVPGHPIPLQTIANICAEYPRYRGKVFGFPKDAIRELTGPIMFTKSVHDVLMRGELAGIAQAGVDFDGHGVFALKGSKVRYMTAPAYIKAKDQPIVL
jgi:mannosyltransferase OCH1-like enzyme